MPWSCFSLSSHHSLSFPNASILSSILCLPLQCRSKTEEYIKQHLMLFGVSPSPGMFNVINVCFYAFRASHFWKNLIRPSLQQTRVLSGKYSHMLIPQSTPCGKTHQNTHGKVTDLAWSSESVRTRWRMDWELTKSDQNQSEQRVGLELLSSFLLLPCQAAAYIVENQDCDV